MAAQQVSRVTSEGVKSVSGFFRAFDIAFFMPGALVLFALWWFRPELWERPQDTVSSAFQSGSDAQSWLFGLVAVIALVVAAFMAGLLCHAIVRILGSILARVGGLMGRPYQHVVTFLFQHPQDETGNKPYNREASELSLYLWNLSSLGWNLAVALLLVPLIRGKLDRGIAPWLVGALLIVLLGSDFRSFSVRMGRQAA
ncbi:MAG: hypothetical protein JXB05_19830 [Myxococcaceae bacterium]|nr:hypothetical protein [Myxococcaceae bacterium]